MKRKTATTGAGSKPAAQKGRATGYNMRLSCLVIKEFRCLRNVEIPLDDITVLIGENNTGKSAVLEALRIGLQRPSVHGATRVQDYDFHMPVRDANPRENPGMVIDLEFAERTPNEWSDDMLSDWEGVAQVGVDDNLYRIRVRFTSRFSPSAGAYQAQWRFLNLQDDEFTPRGGLADKLRLLHRYAQVYLLSALRDATVHFSARSSFWAPLLRSLQIPSEQRQELEASLEALNQALLGADPRLERVTGSLAQATQVFSDPRQQEVAIRALPFKPWDLMSRSEVVIRSGPTGTELPLARHGQGIQSLSVLHLFRAFIEHTAAGGSGPIAPLLALEEPEAHLHPQAARALWRQIEELPFQAIVTTHSPYFAQNVPLSNLRLLRRGPDGTVVHRLRDTFVQSVAPNLDALGQVCQELEYLNYSAATGTLTARGRISEKHFRRLAAAAGKTHVPAIRALQQQAVAYLSPQELAPLESAARRLRGELFFARAWLFCEGESDRLILHQFADMLGLDLDRSGVTIIDWKTGVGSSQAFASLARAFGFPWLLLCDGDQAGSKYIQSLKDAGFSNEEVDRRATQLPSGQAMESYLIANGFQQDLAQVAASRGWIPTAAEASDEYNQSLAHKMHNTEGTRAFCQHLVEQKVGSARVPELLAGLLQKAVNGDGA